MSSSDRTSFRFRVLVPVWGERYIRDFCAISLPSLLADGNLTEIARSAECEIIFLTTRASEDFFERSQAIQRLKECCGYSFIYIDDLLPLESYAIILTVAYGRGIASLGDLQTSTYFIFLNADFVLSNGILRTVLERVRRGFNAVMAPSLRCRQEDVVDDLEKRVDPVTGTIEAKPQDLVRLTLDNLHLTAYASVINQEFLHHDAANQFFWRVDENTIVGRFFLLFMLCIRPERPFTTCAGWCDYAFVPELVPSGNYDLITDSDDGFILEMQARRGELHHIRSGRLTPEGYAPRLSFWTTANHRDYARHAFVFHAGPISSRLDIVNREAEQFMAELFSHLKQPATSHLRHPYWTSGLLHFQNNIPHSATPPELPRYLPGPLEAVRHRLKQRHHSGRIGKALSEMLIGAPPNVRRLHSAYLDYDNFARQINALSAQCSDLVHVRERPSPIDVYLAKAPVTERIDLTEIDKIRSTKRRFDGAVVTLVDQTIDRLPRYLRLLAAHCADGAPILICIDCIESVFSWGRRSSYGDIVDLIGSRLPSTTIETYTLITAPDRIDPGFLLAKAREIGASLTISARLAAVIVAVPAYVKILIANLRSRPEGSVNSAICTSATLWLRGPWQNETVALTERALRFDPVFYNRINTDVAEAGLDPETHFHEYGWKELRDPSPHFSVRGYLSANPDVADATVNPFRHFREHGLAEGRNGWQQ